MTSQSPEAANNGQRSFSASVDAYEARQADFRSHWEDHIKNPVELVKYDKTVVLLLSWDPECDGLNTDKEVGRLEDVLKDTKSYNFEVYRQYLHGDKDRGPDLQIQMHLSTFIYKHTSPQTLLIVYYAGHAWADGVTFKMAGKIDSSSQESEQFRNNTFDWIMAESSLKMTNLDILVVLDCCHAGFLDRLRTHEKRCCEYLVACDSESKTRGPGDRSFTNALTWALRKLGSEDYFTTQHLLKTIRQCPDFPKQQTPLLFPRFEASLFGQHIILNPSGKSLNAAYRSEQQLPQEFIDLRFQFDRTDGETLKRLATALHAAIGPSKDQLAIRRISLLEKDTLLGKCARHWYNQSGTGRSRASSRLTKAASRDSKQSPVGKAEPEAGTPSQYISETTTRPPREDGTIALAPEEEPSISDPSGQWTMLGDYTETKLAPGPSLSPLDTSTGPLTPTSDRPTLVETPTIMSAGVDMSSAKRPAPEQDSNPSPLRRSKRLKS